MITPAEKEILRAATRSIDNAIDDDPPKDWRESLCDAIDAVEGVINGSKRLYMIDAKDDDSTYLVYASSADTAWAYFASQEELSVRQAKILYTLAEVDGTRSMEAP